MGSVPTPTGETYGSWTVTGGAPSKGRHHNVRVQCACGEERVIRLFTLTNGTSTQCRRCASLLADLTGETFGQWTVQHRTDNARTGESRWLCLCTCQNTATVRSSDLRKGRSVSCRDCAHKRRKKT